MKKNNLIMLLLLLLIGLLFMSYHKQNQLKDQYKSSYNNIVEELYRLEEVNDELTSNLNVSETVIANQEDDIDKFKMVTQLLFEEFNDADIRKALFNLFEIWAYIEIDGEEFQLPRQGEMFITEDHFTFYANVQSPDFSDLDFRLSDDNAGLNPLFRTIYFPSTENSIISGNELKLEYKNIKVGDRIQFKTTQVFREAFGVVSETITVTRIDPERYSKGQDYFVTDPLVVTFVEDGTETIVNDYYDVQDDKIEASVEYLNNNNNIINKVYTTIYIRNNAVGTIYYTPAGLIELSTPLDSIILPSLIIKGSEIEKGVNFYSVITNEKVDIEVDGMIYECVELSSYYRNELNNVEYYAKGIGLILSVNNDYELSGRISPKKSE